MILNYLKRSGRPWYLQWVCFTVQEWLMLEVKAQICSCQFVLINWKEVNCCSRSFRKGIVSCRASIAPFCFVRWFSASLVGAVKMTEIFVSLWVYGLMRVECWCCSVVCSGSDATSVALGQRSVVRSWDIALFAAIQRISQRTIDSQSQLPELVCRRG